MRKFIYLLFTIVWLAPYHSFANAELIASYKHIVSETNYSEQNDAPKAKFSLSYTKGCSPLEVLLTNKSTSSTSCTYIWEIDGEKVSEEEHLNYTFTNNEELTKTFIVRLTITDSDNQTSNFEEEIEVLPNPLLVDNTLETCEDNITLKVKPNSTGKWELIAGHGKILAPDSPETKVTELYEGINTFKWIDNNKICDDQTIIKVHNNSFSTFAGNDKVIKTSYYEFNAQAPPYGGTGKWTLANGSAKLYRPDKTDAIAYSYQRGNTTFEWTVTVGDCIAKDQINIFYETIEANAGEDQQLCSSSAQLNAQEAESGHWSIVSGSGVIANPSSSTTLVTELSEGENIFKWEVSHLDYSESDNVSIYNYGTNTANEEYIICDNSVTIHTKDYNLLPNSTSSWETPTNNQTIESVSENTFSFKGLVAGSNIFTQKISKITTLLNNSNITCEDSVTIEIFSHAEDFAEFEVSELAGCSPLNVTFTNTTETGNDIQYLWQVNDITYSTEKNFSHIFQQIGDTKKQYKVSLWANAPNANCTDSTSQIIEVYPIPDVNFTSNEQVISSNEKEVSVTNYTWGGNTYLWDFGNENLSQEFEPSYTYNNSDSYAIHLNAKNTFECSSDFTQKDYNSNIAEFVASETSGCHPLFVHFENTSILPKNSTYQWEIDGQKVSQGKSFSYTFSNESTTTKTHKVLLTITDSNGNTTSSEKNIEVIQNTEFESTQHITCSNTFNLNVQNPENRTGQWEVVSGNGTISSPSSTETIVSNLSKGLNVVLWKFNENECQNQSQITIEYTQPEVDFTLPLKSGCSPLSLVFNNITNSNTTNQYVWKIDNEIVSTSTNLRHTFENETDISITKTVELIATDNNQCTASKIETITIESAPLLMENNAYICNGELELKARPLKNGNGYWKLLSGFGDIQDKNSHITVIKNIPNTVSQVLWETGNKQCNENSHVYISSKKLEAKISKHETSGCSPFSPVLHTSQPFEIKTIWKVNGVSFSIYKSEDFTFTTTTEVRKDTVTLVVSKGENCIDSTSIFIETIPNALLVDSEIITCTDSLTLKVRSEEKGKWTVNSGGGKIHSPNNTETKVTEIHEGINTFQWFSTNNTCSNKNIVTIINNSFETYAGQDPLDPTQSTVYNLSATQPPIGATGMWSVSGGGAGTFLLADYFETSVYNMNIGINTYEWKVTWNGCTATDQISIYRTNLNTNAGQDQHTCSKSIQLNANDDETGSWSIIAGSGNIEEPTNPKTVVSDLSKGENIFRWKVSMPDHSYSEHDDVSIFNYGIETYTAAYETCENTITVDVKDYKKLGDDYITTWKAPTANHEIKELTNTSVQFSGLTEGTNRFVLNLQNTSVIEGEENKSISCKDSTVIEISQHEKPTPQFEASESLGCSPLDVTFTNQTSNSENLQYHWQIDDVHYSSATDFSHTFKQIGDKKKYFKVSLWANDPSTSCTDSVSQLIEVYPSPEVNFTAFPSIVKNKDEKVEFKNYSWGGVAYKWNLGENSTSSDFEPSHIYNSANIYSINLTATNEFGCSSDLTQTDYITVTPSATSTNAHSTQAQIKVFPSITKEKVKVGISNVLPEHFVIELLNYKGQIIETKKIERGLKEVEFNIGEQTNGFYFINVKSRSESKTFKIVKI